MTGSPGKSFTPALTEKAIGIGIAAVFALWSWMLNNLAEEVKQGIGAIETEQRMIRGEMSALRQQVVNLQVSSASEFSELRTRQNEIYRRVGHVENGNGARGKN